MLIKKIVKYLIERGVDVNKPNFLGVTPIFVACQYGNTTIVKYLMKHGADINIKSNHNETPLSFACQSRNKDLIDYLLLHGANIDIIYIDPVLSFRNPRINIQKYISNYKAKKRKYSHIE